MVQAVTRPGIVWAGGWFLLGDLSFELEAQAEEQVHWMPILNCQ